MIVLFPYDDGTLAVCDLDMLVGSIEDGLPMDDAVAHAAFDEMSDPSHEELRAVRKLAVDDDADAYWELRRLGRQRAARQRAGPTVDL